MTIDNLKDQILAKGNIPEHIAVIMDGNGRWARAKGQPRVFGHREGMKSVRSVVEGCREIGCKVLTLYAFSEENWSRPRAEIDALMKLLQTYIIKEREELKKNGVRVGCIGRLDKLEKSPRKAILEAIEYTADEERMQLILAISYSSRSEMVDSVRSIAKQAKEGALDIDEINEKLISQNLYTANIPDPDLLIRTSGEMRLSNFLLWQAAYTELYVTDVLWPDFRKEDLFAAISDYQKRDRRFGKINE